MGCDIHIDIQVQDEGTWRSLPYQTDKSDWREAWKPVPGIPVAPCGFDGRNYRLFGILANVRNGSGFAGAETGTGWPSIAPDRGLPAGFDEGQVPPHPEYPEEGPRWLGDHSFTWIALEELKAFDWDGVKSTLYGVVPAQGYETLRAADVRRPTSYRDAVSGRGIQTFEEPVYAGIKAAEQAAARAVGVSMSSTDIPTAILLICPRPHVRAAWQETAREATNDWPGKVIPWLEGLANGRPLRLVLGFDN